MVAVFNVKEEGVTSHRRPPAETVCFAPHKRVAAAISATRSSYWRERNFGNEASRRDWLYCSRISPLADPALDTFRLRDAPRMFLSFLFLIFIVEQEQKQVPANKIRHSPFFAKRGDGISPIRQMMEIRSMIGDALSRR